MTSQPSTIATLTRPADSSTVPAELAGTAAALHRTGVLLRDCTPQDLVRLQLRLLSYAKLLGLSNVPDDGQLRLLAGFLVRAFPDVTEAELDAALERWAAGQLAADLRPYGSLTIDFLGGLLAAWRLERRHDLRRLERAEAERELARQEAEAQPPTDDWHDRLVRSYAAEYGELPLIADWQACWRHLRATGELLNLSPDQLEDYERQALAELEARRRLARLAGRELPDDPGHETPRWHAYLREQRARQYYLQLLKRPTT